jgi:hypothetical protein
MKHRVKSSLIIMLPIKYKNKSYAWPTCSARASSANTPRNSNNRDLKLPSAKMG